MDICVKKISKWAPGLYSEQDWFDWALGKKEILLEKTSPSLDWAPSIFRRRLSQISKMTVQVVHELFSTPKENNKNATDSIPIDKNTKLVFISKRGEIDREFKINKSLIQDGTILPAAFSLSVFNTPIAQSTIAEGLKGGYSAIYPSNANFRDAFLCAVSPVLCGDENQIALVYADELVPECYNGINIGESFSQKENIPLAFAMIICPKSKKCDIIVDVKSVPESPVQFLRELLIKQLQQGNANYETNT